MTSADGPTAGWVDERVSRYDAPGSAVPRPRQRAYRAHHVRERLRQRRTANLVYRSAVGALGGAVVLLGLVLVPFPGPGWLIVFGGLAILATEFEWAQRLLAYGRRTLTAWTRWLQRQHLAVRLLVAGGTAAFVAAVTWVLLVWQGLPAWLPADAETFLGRMPGL